MACFFQDHTVKIHDFQHLSTNSGLSGLKKQKINFRTRGNPDEVTLLKLDITTLTALHTAKITG